MNFCSSFFLETPLWDPQTPLSRAGTPHLGYLPQADEGSAHLPPCPSRARGRPRAPSPNGIRLAALYLFCAAQVGPSLRQPRGPRLGRSLPPRSPPKVTCALAHHLDRLVDHDPLQHGSSHSQWSCQELATFYTKDETVASPDSSTGNGWSRAGEGRGRTSRSRWCASQQVTLGGERSDGDPPSLGPRGWRSNENHFGHAE